MDEKQASLLQNDLNENASLETLLSNQTISLLDLLSVKHIQTKIRSNFSFFIKHCQKNQQFCFNLIDIAIHSPINQSTNETFKQACYVATDTLTCDQDIIADLLILPDKWKENHKDESDGENQLIQEIQEHIETQNQHSTGHTDANLMDQQLNEQESFSKKYKYLNRVLEYICENDTKNLDQNCINYLVKTLNCLLRKKANQFLEFLQKKPQILKRLIEINNFSSVNQFLIKLLSDDEIKGQSFYHIKKTIIEDVLSQLMSRVNQEDFSERLDFLDQLFQTNKYSSDDDRTQLQKLSDVFSSQKTIQFFYQNLINPKTVQDFFNSICYLTVIVKRMNVDQEVDPYSYTNTEREETMIFQIDILFKKFPTILSSGYQSLTRLKYSQQYKQKIMEVKFYEFLVLLTKNSRFSNCSNDIKQGAFTKMKGNNIIFSTSDEKINTLKQLLKQFSTQTKSGINRINIISLIQKILNLQIYQEINHSQQENKVLQKEPSQNQIKPQQESKQTENSQNTSNKQTSHENSVEQENDSEDKKKKMNKIKAGLKLNIKKFALQASEADQKPAQQPEIPNKKQQEKSNTKKLQSSIKRNQALEILKYFDQLLKSNTDLNKQGNKKKVKNNETEISAFINKIIVIISDSVWWAGQNDEIINKEKDQFISEVQSIFTSFSFEDISRIYSTTLATNKHPNASARQKTNPELNFSSDFFKIYSKKKDSVQKNRQSSTKNLEFSDSDFKSDNEEDCHATKCTLQDFKKFTSFKFEDQRGSKTNDIPQTQRVMVTEQSLSLKNETEVSDSQQTTDKQNTTVQKEKQQLLTDISQGQILNSQNTADHPTKIQENQIEKLNENKERQNKQIQKKEGKKEQKVSTKIFQNKQKSDKESQAKYIPLQFLIKHRLIFV